MLSNEYTCAAMMCYLMKFFWFFYLLTINMALLKTRFIDYMLLYINSRIILLGEDQTYTMILKIFFVLFMAAGVNLFYRGIKLMLYIKKVNEEETTFHTFKCTACNEVYQLNGIETKAKCRRALVKKIQTIHSQTTSVKFTCPHCHSNVYQERIFDINMTKFSGNIRIQMDQRAPDPKKGLY